MPSRTTFFVDSSLPRVDEDTFDGVETAPNSLGREWVEMSPCATVPVHVFLLVWFYLIRGPWGTIADTRALLFRGAEVCNPAGGGPEEPPTYIE